VTLNIGSVDLNLLRVFDAIVRHGNLTAAGESVGLSQPGMSNALTRLRTLFDDALFVRAPNGMKPTEYALALSVPIHDALEMLNTSLRMQVKFDPATAAKSFHVCTTDIGALTFLPSLLERIRDVAPGLTLKFGQYPIRECREMLSSGELDLAVGYFPDLTTGVYQRMLFDDHYVCIVSKKHPRIRDCLTLEQFLAESHASVLSPGTGHALLLQRLTLAQPRIRFTLDVREFASLPPIIAKTDLVATVPSRLAALFRQVVDIQLFTPPIELPSFKIMQFWHERNHHDPTNIWLRELFVELFGYPRGTAYVPSYRPALPSAVAREPG